MKEPEMAIIAGLIHRALESRDNPAALAALREEVHAFSRRFPLPG
jgi:glycine/serine hydroxymethyltransferase